MGLPLRQIMGLPELLKVAFGRGAAFLPSLCWRLLSWPVQGAWPSISDLAEGRDPTELRLSAGAGFRLAPTSPHEGRKGAKSESWQDREHGMQVRDWIEQWEMSLDDVDLELPEPLEEIDPGEHAGAIEDAPGKPHRVRARAPAMTWRPTFYWWQRADPAGIRVAPRRCWRGAVGSATRPAAACSCQRIYEHARDWWRAAQPSKRIPHDRPVCRKLSQRTSRS